MIGQTISHYRVTGKIGEGGMGEVYSARDIKLNRDVALKVLPEAVANSADRLARFEREAQMLAKLNHPNIATIHGLEEHDGKQILIMELVEGETLEKKIQSGPLPLDESVRLGTQIAEALQTAHRKGIIHRDLKPSNIKITPEGLVKVLDFGLAKQFYASSDQTDSKAATLVHSMTTPGMIVGTPAYMSPEQALGQPVDARTDIFSFGTVLYEMLTGQRAFAGATTTAVIQAVLTANPRSPRRVRADIPIELDTMVIKAMSKEPDKRDKNLEEMSSELRGLMTRSSSRKTGLVTAPLQTLRNASWHIRSFAVDHKKASLSVAALLIVSSFFLLGAFVFRRGAATSTSDAGSVSINKSSNTYDLFRQGLKLLERYDKIENVDAAMQAFKIAIDKDAKYAPAYAGLGLAYIAKYQYDRDKVLLDMAVQNGKQAVQLDGEVAINRVSLGRAFVERGDYDLAEAELNKALTLDPLNADAYRGLGDIQKNKKNWNEGENFYKRALELRPNDWDIYLALGNLYFRASRYPEAEKAYTDSINLAPDGYLGYRNLGAVYHLQGRFAEASAQYQKSLQIRPAATTYSNLGTSLFYQGLYQESVVAMEKAIELGANNSQNWANLGDAYRWSPGKQEKAKEAFSSAIQLVSNDLKSKPDDADLRSRLALYLAKIDEKQKALAEAATLEPLKKSASVLARLVLVYEICGQRARALEAMTAALKDGYSAEEFIRDPELLQLRQDPSYHKVIAKFSVSASK